MKKNFSLFLKAWKNIFIFLPYFFSVKNLLQTLFYPWKNIVFSQDKKGLSLGEWFEIWFSNIISRIIGFFMRMSLLLFYLLLLIFLAIIFPLSVIIFFLIQPFTYFLTFWQKDENEQRMQSQKRFLETHLLDQKNKDEVLKWFENYYQKYLEKKIWWDLKNLLSFPPLARDWSYGYTYNLDQYGQELTSEKYLASRPSIIDRENEITQIEQILARSMEPNVILIGEEGVGKHTVVDALATRIYHGQSHPQLAYRRIFKLNMEKILAKYTDKSQREEFFDELLYEAAQAKNLIILIDNFDLYVNIYQQDLNLSSVIEKYAKTNSLQFITLTNLYSYQKFVLPNEKIIRLFTPVKIEEVNLKLTLKILQNLTFSFENRYQVLIPYETLLSLVDKSQFFITQIPFPEKAIVLLNEICVYSQTNKIKIIQPSLVDHIISKKIHMPTTLTPEIKEKLINLDQLLKQRIIFQDQAIDHLSNSIKRAFVLLGKRKEPLAKFLFLGPTGVGKTETAKALAEIFFGSEKYLIRFDMALYQSKNDIPKLIGDVSTANPGLLSKSIREQPYGVLLLDEIEKADHNLINIFLTVLDEGYFTDGYGKRVDCHNLVIIATSNVGASLIFEKIKNDQLIDQKVLENEIINFLTEKNIFSPEFLNRFDGIIFYQPLTKVIFKKVAEKIFTEDIEKFEKLYGIKINVTEEFLDELAKKNFNPAFGARDIRRLIETEIEYKITNLLLNKKIDQETVLTF